MDMAPQLISHFLEVALVSSQYKLIATFTLLFSTSVEHLVEKLILPITETNIILLTHYIRLMNIG